VLADLVALGAPADIEVDARPHIGSNRLPKLLEALRARLQSLGVRYQFNCAFIVCAKTKDKSARC